VNRISIWGSPRTDKESLFDKVADEPDKDNVSASNSESLGRLGDV
jgi:hypothetical protein